MARLILLPYEPGDTGGYQKAVQSDMDRLNIDQGDRVVVYSDGTATAIPDAYFIARRGKQRISRRPDAGPAF